MGPGQIIPICEIQLRRQSQRRGGGQGFQKGPAHRQWLAPYILPLMFQQVIGHQDHRGVGQQFAPRRFAGDPGLQGAEWQRGIVGKGQNLAINHRPLRQKIGNLTQFGKTLGQQILAPRPQMMGAAAQDQLAPDSIPFPFGRPICWWPKVGQIVQRMSKCKRVGPRCAVTIRRNQGGIGGAGGRPVAHQPVGQDIGRGARGLPQGAGQQLGADPHPKPPGQQFGEQEPLQRGQLVPCGQDARLAGGLVCLRQGFQRLDPVGQAVVRGRGRRRQDQCDGFGQIADDGIGFLEQPQRNACGLRRPLAQQGGADHPFWPPPGEQRDAPQLVHGRGGLEIGGQGRHFGTGAGGLVQCGEQGGKGFHAALSSFGASSPA